MTTAPVQYLTTKELAELLRIKERKVYDLVSSGEVPCTRATGKLLFSRSAVELWLASSGNGQLSESVLSRPNVFLGSHDPLLEWALKESGCGLATYFDGSLDGIERFANDEGVAAALHVFESRYNDWNRSTIAGRFHGQAVVLVEFCWRQRGLIVDTTLIESIRTIKDLRGRRVTPRQVAAGSQTLLLHLLETNGVAINQVDFAPTAHTETDAAVAVLEGKADAAFGLSSLAQRYHLGFVPLLRERFDLLVDRRAWFEPSLQKFVVLCNSACFIEKAAEFDGYEVAGFGTVHFNG